MYLARDSGLSSVKYALMTRADSSADRPWCSCKKIECIGKERQTWIIQL